MCLGAGACSGLTVGYLSIDELQLELKLKNGTEEEKRAVGFSFEVYQVRLIPFV